jgi:hypothetical protein
MASKTLRRYLLTHASTAMGYLTCAGYRERVDSILDDAVSQIHARFGLDKKQDVKLIVVGNSLGGIVGMRFLAEKWKWRGHSLPTGISNHWNDLKVDLLLSLGAPIDWFVSLILNFRLVDPRSVSRLASKLDSRTPSSVKLNEYLSTVAEGPVEDFWKKSGMNLIDILPTSLSSCGWYNFYYPEDICAGEIKNLTEGLKKSVTADIAISGSDKVGIFAKLQDRLVYPLMNHVNQMLGNVNGNYLEDERVWSRIEKLLIKNDLV